MGERDPTEAVEVLDMLLKFFGDGERWVKGRLSDRRGNRCLAPFCSAVPQTEPLLPRGERNRRFLGPIAERESCQLALNSSCAIK